MSNYIINGPILDVCSGEIIQNGSVVVEAERIRFAGNAESVLAHIDIDQAETITVNHGIIMPGLIDCHAHLTGNHGNDTFHSASNFDRILEAAHQIGTLLDAGFTTVQDMSLFGPYLKRAVNKGILRGPKLIPGGRIISPTGGHADTYPNLPWDFVNSCHEMNYMADGVSGCLRAVREQFRQGAEYIKLCATGGVSSACDKLTDIQFSPEEMRAIVDEAARHGTYVIAHASGAAGTYQALQAGVSRIEHGDDLDDRCIDFMVKNNIPLVTTLFVSELCATPGIFPDYMLEKGRDCMEMQRNSIRRAFNAGVTVALGTDFGDSQYTPYSRNGMEFESIVRAGFSNLDAIRMGTINAAIATKKQHEIGTLEAGKAADIIVVDGNPLDDISVLADQDHIKFVMKNGFIEKQS